MIELQKIKDLFKNLEFKVQIEKFIVQNAESDVTFKVNGETVFADLRNEVRPNHVPIFLNRRDNPLLVAADYITPKSKETLKSKGVNYIDSYGNVYLNLKHLKIYIEKDNAKPIYNAYSDVFTRAGGQILFQLLQNPELINANQEHLADISCVSLGSVSKTIKGLQKEGFAVKWNKEKKYQLVKREELLEKWIALANEKILPSHKIGSYSSVAIEGFKMTHINSNSESCWGGEYGAKLITNYLSPEKYSLFTTERADLMRLFRIVPDEEGEISVYKTFWKPKSIAFQTNNDNIPTNPLLVYAELIYSGNERNLETAKIIFDEYIKPNL
ncbi:type IV toxin-antitoxin system AbiEi family antitoxin [uncultured Maribacter sp.]|uniref:type IV toxin-antitoxin system AbiEi family antitoxin n=1 Tax=uncultured Maribacter sp. TaxID=431308 RepID=UPI0030DCB1F6|tara:strand:+ start:3851 stop:4834 length:984 start_codon:yes stop_codon:yes gene_type:complete